MKKRVLIVDDERRVLSALRRMLKAERDDWETTCFGRPEDAWESLLETKYDVVISDVKMPGMSGLELLKRIQNEDRTKDIPVVMMTGLSDHFLKQQALELGAADLLNKPVDSGQLVARLDNAFRERASHDLLRETCRTAHQHVDHVSHEFRTPLAVIKAYTEVIRDGLTGPVNTRQQEFLGVINDQVENLAILVDDMLDASRLKAGLLGVWRRRCAVTDILENVRPVLERKAAVKNVDLQIMVDENLPAIYCDQEKIGRVVINLVVNATKFCGEDGHVQLWARADSDNSEVVIGVTDDGPGIAEEDLQLIFDRFRQAGGTNHGSSKGFGLGLSICKELVDLHFGEIRVESEPGSGSRFFFTVPVHSPSKLATRCLQRLKRLPESSGAVALIVAETRPGIQQTVSNGVDEFLQSVFRKNDLVVRTERHRWLIMADCAAEEVDGLLDRVTTTWREVNARRTDARLPEIACIAKNTARTDGENEEMLRQFPPELPTEIDNGAGQSHQELAPIGSL